MSTFLMRIQTGGFGLLILWTFSSSKSFFDFFFFFLMISSKSFFEILCSNSTSASSFPFKKIWNSLVPPRIQAFLWITSLGQMNTMDMLHKRRPYMALSPRICVLCLECEESGGHILIHCKFARFIWIFFLALCLNGSYL